MQVAAGGFHFLSLLENGDCYAWGNNHYGQVGDGTTRDQPMPTRILRNVKKVSAGFNHSLAVMRDGELFAWGSNTSGQLGDGTHELRKSPVVVKSGKDPLYEVLDAAAGKDHSLAIVRAPGKSRRHCYGWGANVSGLQACESPSAITSTTLTGVAQVALEPVLVCQDVDVVAAGMSHSLAIRENGDLVSWGRNTEGQLGDGTTVNRLEGVKILERVKTVSAGVDYSIAVTEEGECFTWGSNSGGRLGDGTTLDRHYPTKVFDDVAVVSAGHNHALVVTGEGECFGWGRNQHSCICSSGNPKILRPILVRRKVVTVAAGGSHSFAFDSKGDFLVWGRDWHGQLSSLQLFDAAQATASFEQGPNRMEFEAQEIEQRAQMSQSSTNALAAFSMKATRSLTMKMRGTKTALSMLMKASHKAADGESDNDSDFDDDSDEELPPPPGWAPPEVVEEIDEAEDITQEEPPAEEVEEEEMVGEEEPDFAALHARWVRLPMERFGKGVHGKIHQKAKQTSRNYILLWNQLRRSGELAEDCILPTLHAQIVENAWKFRAADATLGRATSHGFTHEDCHPLTGLLAVEAEFLKAVHQVLGPEADLFGELPPGVSMPTPRKKKET